MMVGEDYHLQIKEKDNETEIENRTKQNYSCGDDVSSCYWVCGYSTSFHASILKGTIFFDFFPILAASCTIYSGIYLN